MTIREMYKKSTLEAALNEFSKKYAHFCNSHTCSTCVLAPATPSPLNWRQQCKANTIDHLTEANKKMDNVLEKEAEAKKKKENTAKYLACAIKAEKRDLEYRNKRDAEYIVLNPDDANLLKAVSGYALVCCVGEPGYDTLFGMRVLVSNSIERGKFAIGFKTDTHLKYEEASE